MKPFRTTFLLAALLIALLTHAQVPVTYSSSEIYQQLRKLKVLGSVLYIAAHPDDENTRLIAWLANEKLYRTGYLSLTRGDGGQNLIGDEQGAELGLIRTQELLAARRVDGGEQMFTRATDFGFSKSPEEAFLIWGKDKIQSDVVWIIRRFQPDVIVARFPEDGRAGHGHHSASGIMAREGYELAGDPSKFTDQLGKGVTVWQPKRVLWNTFNFGGGTNTIDSTQFSVDVGSFNPWLGKGIGELAGEARSQHKSQGFGVSRQRGSAREFFSLIKGDLPKKDLLDGINSGWTRLKGGEEIEKLVDEALAKFNFSNPAASIPILRRLVARVQALEPSVWREVKMKELQQLLLNCIGFYAEATVSSAGIVAGDSTTVAINLVNRSSLPVKLNFVQVGRLQLGFDRMLGNNELLRRDLRTVFDGSILDTQPYWLREGTGNGTYNVSEQRLIGLAETQNLKAVFNLTIDSVEVTVERPVQHRLVDPVKAEQYHPAYFTNPYLIFNNPGIVLFRKDQRDSAVLEMNINGLNKETLDKPQIKLTNASGKYSKLIDAPSLTYAGGDVQMLRTSIPNFLRGSGQETDALYVSLLPGGQYGETTFSNARRTIAYDHIPNQTWHYQDVVKVLNIDLKTVAKKVGYLPGAGDRVAVALQQMGYQVTELKQEDLTAARLAQYDAIVTGVRAYNVHSYLSDAHKELMEYVKQGGNLIVQYNTNSNVGPVRAKISPVPMSISRARITDETAEVKFLLPDHPALNYPNKISAKDFEGWVQERSIYHAEGLDATFKTPISMADPSEQANNGALAIAPFGKGNFVYTGLVFFRQLPAGVPGAYRLMANLVDLPKNK